MDKSKTNLIQFQNILGEITLNENKRKANAIKIAGTIAILIVISIVFIYPILKASNEKKIKENKKKIVELNEDILEKQNEANIVREKLKDYRSLELYIASRDSLVKIINRLPAENYLKTIKESIEEKKYSINWLQKAVPRKRHYTNKKNRGEPLGYWEEDDDADIENIEVEYGMTIEKYLVQERNDKTRFEKELQAMKNLISTTNLKKLEIEIKEVEITIEKITKLNSKIKETNEAVKNIKLEIEALRQFYLKLEFIKQFGYYLITC